MTDYRASPTKSEKSNGKPEPETKEKVSLSSRAELRSRWPLVVASFWIMHNFGFTFVMFTVVYDEISLVFNATKGMTGLVGSVNIASGNLLGLLAGSLVQRFGCRVMAGAGGIMVSLGLLASSFAPSIYVLCVTFGFISGFGTGTTYLTALVVVQQSFARQRAIAAAVAGTGMSMGFMLGGPVNRLLLDHYGLRGTFMIVSGISLHLLPCALLLQPERLKDKHKHKHKHNPTTHAGPKEPIPVKERNSPESSEINDVRQDHAREDKHVTRVDAVRCARDQPSDDVVCKHDQPSDAVGCTHDQPSDAVRSTRDQPNDAVGSTRDQPIDAVRSTRDQPIDAVRSTRDQPSDAVGSTRDQPCDAARPAHGCPRCRRLGKWVRSLSVLLDPGFVLLATSTVLYNVAHWSFLAHTPSRATSLGVHADHVSTLLTVLGFSVLVFRLVAGLVGNLEAVNVTLVYSLALLSAGLLQMFYSFATTFPAIMLFCTVYGAPTGVIFSLQPTVLTEILSGQKIAISQGALQTFVGIGRLISIPLTGFIYDATGDYVVPFYVVGVSQLLAGLLVLASFCRRWRSRRNSSYDDARGQ